MRIPRPRLPRQTARLRLTLLYGGVFVAGAAAVFAVTYLLDTNNPYNHVHNLPPALVSRIKQLDRHFSQVAQAAFHRASSEREQQVIWSGVALAVAVVGAVVLGWFIAGRVLRPLSAITAAARRISASSLHERLSLAGPEDELKELGDTLDDLFARLKASFDAQRRFVANASHELRTPITRERTLLQVTRANPALTLETWQAVSAELLASNAEQAHLIEALLTLASSEGGPGDWERGDLAPLASACLAAAGGEAGRLGLRVRASIQPAALDGDPLLVRRLVSNLVENAVRHNVPGGHIQVSTGTREGRAFVSVTNTGPVIPSAEVDRLFQPFQRLGGRRARGDGHGLGLSIVRAIAEAHGATITAEPEPSGGLAIAVTFPAPAGPRVDQPRVGQPRVGQTVGRSAALGPQHARWPASRSRRAADRERTEGGLASWQPGPGIPRGALGTLSRPLLRPVRTGEATVQQSQPGSPRQPPPGKDLLEGKVVVLTAAAGTGIGGAAALRCLDEGASLALSDAHAARLAASHVRLADRFGADRVWSAPCDVTSEPQVQALIDGAVRRFGRIDVMINNAGLGGTTSLPEMTDEQWSRVLDVTLTGTFRCTRAALRQMIAQGGGGAIVNNASVLGWRAQAGQAHYSAAKAGVMALTRCAAMDVAEHGIRVNAVSPSLAMHPFLAKVISQDVLDELVTNEAFGRSAEPWEVANVMVFLASDYASYLTGEVISVSSQHA